MRIIFSRKGFDSGSGGKPSPIIDGRPISLPIPATRGSETTYRDIGLGDIVSDVTRGKIGPDHLCHTDPYFADGMCAFGQTGAAQGHLAKNSVGPGDVFLFFGLFADEVTRERHHRIFGFLVVDGVLHVGASPDRCSAPAFARDHPHFIGVRDRNNTVYVGPGGTCSTASAALRLTQTGGPLCAWDVPAWLKKAGLTYHEQPWRWPSPGKLSSVSRGQEFICDIGSDPTAQAWLASIVAQINGERPAEPDDRQEVVIAMLRQPRLDDPNEQRNDPFWEFGSFGVTGCHSRNLLNPRRAHELKGKRIAFAQGGPNGFKLVYLTPPVSIAYHSTGCELLWSPAEMPLTYMTAPTIIDNSGRTDFPALLGMLEGVHRNTPVAQFASKFRSRREAVPKDFRNELVTGFTTRCAKGGKRAKSYVDCLPYPPPKIDGERRKTYEALRRQSLEGTTLAVAGPNKQRSRC